MYERVDRQSMLGIAKVLDVGLAAIGDGVATWVSVTAATRLRQRKILLKLDLVTASIAAML